MVNGTSEYALVKKKSKKKMGKLAPGAGREIVLKILAKNPDIKTVDIIAKSGLQKQTVYNVMANLRRDGEIPPRGKKGENLAKRMRYASITNQEIQNGIHPNSAAGRLLSVSDYAPDSSSEKKFRALIGMIGVDRAERIVLEEKARITQIVRGEEDNG